MLSDENVKQGKDTKEMRSRQGEGSWMIRVASKQTSWKRRV